MISVLILTYNEEQNLPHCLESVKWADDVVVLDSGSTDRTQEIARAAGARVFERRWDNEKEQRSYSLTLPFRYPWVFNPDADEVATPELVTEMQKVVADAGRSEIAYRMRFKVMFLGRWIKHSSFYPTWAMRLFRPEKISFERSINLRYVVNGDEGRLQGHFEHHTFRKGLSAWFEKHNYYSDLEAREAVKVLRTGKHRWRELFSGDPLRRRAAWKDLSFRVPCRSTLIFLYLMLVRGGILDGPTGWLFCRMRACYEAMIAAKVKELLYQEHLGSS